MSTVAAGIAALFSSGGKFAHLAKKGAELIRTAESSPSALARFDSSSAQATREMLKDCYAAVKALLAHSLGREPSDPEIDAILGEVTEHPNAPFRMHRLLGEARKSASRRRRRFLASVLFGLEFSAMPDDEVSRVDMVVERLVPQDVELLVRIDEMNRTALKLYPVPALFEGTQVVALINGVEVRVVSTNDYHSVHDDQEIIVERHVYNAGPNRVDQAAFGTLISLGCLDIGQSRATQDLWDIHRLMITEVGRLLVRAIEEVRPGFVATSE